MRKVLIGLFLLLTTPAIAQWQVPNNSVPIGKGPGKVGFSYAAGSTGSGTKCLTDTVPPSFVACSGGGAGALLAANNLSDVASVATSRTNLGLGTAALLAATAVLQTANNLSDLANAITARTNLGLGSMATQAAGAVAITGGTITGLPACAAASDACPKSYIDGIAAGFHVIVGIPSARLATAAVLPNTPTYANGASGVGATLTAGANSTLTVDATVANLSDVVLVKDQAAPEQNGIYTVTTAGSGGAPWVLTRHASFDAPAEMTVGSVIAITSGATNLSNSYALSGTVATVGTTAANFSLYIVAGTANWTLSGSDVYRTTGVVGVGGAPAAWITSDRKTLQVGSGAVFNLNSNFATVVAGNYYINSGGIAKYLNTNFAAAFVVNTSGTFEWYTAPSGTAGDTATFTKRSSLSVAGAWTWDAYTTAGVITNNASGVIASNPSYTTSVFYASDPTCSVVAGLGAGTPQNTQLKCALDLSAANNAKPVVLPCGDIYLSTTLTPTTVGLPVTVRGCSYTGQAAYTSPATRLITTAGFTTGDVIYVKADGAVEFSGFGIDAVTQRTTGAAIELSANVAAVNQNSTIQNMTLNKQATGILCTQCGNPYIGHNVITNFQNYGIYADHGAFSAESSLGRIEQNTITGVNFGTGNDGNTQATAVAGIYTEVGYVWIDTNGIGNVQNCVQVSPRKVNAGNIYVINNSCENATNNGTLFLTADNSNAQFVWVQNNHCFNQTGSYVALHFVCVYFSLTNADHSWITDVDVSGNSSFQPLTTGTHYNIQAGSRLTFSNNKGATSGAGSGENCFTFTNYVAAETLVTNSQCTGATYPTRMYSASIGVRYTDPLGLPFANLPTAGDGSSIFVTDGQQTSAVDQAVKAGGAGVPGVFFLGNWRTMKY